MKKLEEVLKDWEAVIGLEVHAELTTLETKMFCGCKLEFGAAPNTHTCPVCLGLPGALPVPNKAAIESIVLAGLATNCDIEKRSMFYRKNYMYPDMSKNFQITQGPVAFCMRGHLDLEVDGAAAKERVDLKEAQEEGSYVAHIGIERIHMEEDAGKMVHIGGGEGRIAGATHSLIDYNRCGTPLIELVTQPDLRTPEEARLFMQKLRQIYLAIGISDCSMEEGSLRCDGNVSLRRRGETKLGTKTELKNMNSFTFIEKAEQQYDEAQAKKLEEKLRKNRLTLSDYLDQLEQLQKMGDLSQIAGMLPGGLGKQLDNAQLDEKQMAHTKAIILSMTPQERENPQILNASRKKRIAAGCGLQVMDVNRLLKGFEMLQQMTKSMAKGNFRGIPGMGGMPGMGGGRMRSFGRKKRFK